MTNPGLESRCSMSSASVYIVIRISWLSFTTCAFETHESGMDCNPSLMVSRQANRSSTFLCVLGAFAREITLSVRHYGWIRVCGVEMWGAPLKFRIHTS